MNTTWSREQVQALVDEGGFYYQNIDLPYGLSTGGTDRSPTARAIFPDDMTGKTVLDLGCKFGFFCFEALKRGAKRAVGVDVDPYSLERARRLADCLGLDATFELFDIEKEPIRERFDYVLCLNLLHHLRNPLTALERLAAVTDERLILESATMGRHDRRRLRLSPFETLLLRRRPILYASRNGTSDRRNVQKFFITPSAIENLLRYQSNAFARVDKQPSDHKNRYISVAHRRRIGELVVVAGATGSGSRRARASSSRAVRRPRWRRSRRPATARASCHVDANDFSEFGEPEVERLILHYDILRPHRRSAKTHARDEVMDVLRCARRVTFVTLWRPPELLRRSYESEPGLVRDARRLVLRGAPAPEAAPGVRGSAGADRPLSALVRVRRGDPSASLRGVAGRRAAAREPRGVAALAAGGRRRASAHEPRPEARGRQRCLLALALRRRLAAAPARPRSSKLTILHTNDLHGRARSRRARDRDDPRAAREPPGARSCSTPATPSRARSRAPVETGGRAVVDFMNRAGYDGYTPGDNEFVEFRLEDVLANVRRFSFPTLSANLRVKGRRSGCRTSCTSAAAPRSP